MQIVVASSEVFGGTSGRNGSFPSGPSGKTCGDGTEKSRENCRVLKRIVDHAMPRSRFKVKFTGPSGVVRVMKGLVSKSDGISTPTS